MPRIFYISSRVATQSPVLKTCHSKLNNLVAGNDAMKPLQSYRYLLQHNISHTSSHISHNNIFTFSKNISIFHLCGRREEGGWFDIESRDMRHCSQLKERYQISIWGPGHDNFVKMKIVVLSVSENCLQWLTTVEMFTLIKGQCNAMYHFCRFLLQSSCDWCNILCLGFTMQIYE